MRLEVVVLFCTLRSSLCNVHESYFKENSRLANSIVGALQDPNFQSELLFDMRKENQIYSNRTMSLVIKYIVKREVDNYRSRRTDAISRRVYSSLVMKLIDIAKDLPRNSSSTSRIDTAHRYYVAVANRDAHDQMADAQVFHACARLYEIMFTVLALPVQHAELDGKDQEQAPKILHRLGNLDELTPQLLLRNLRAMDIQPVHLGIALVIQYHLRNTANYAVRSNALGILSTRPQEVGVQVMATLRALAAHLLPVSELLDVHLAHSSRNFKSTCPNTWLGIVNKK